LLHKNIKYFHLIFIYIFINYSSFFEKQIRIDAVNQNKNQICFCFLNHGLRDDSSSDIQIKAQRLKKAPYVCGVQLFI
jgi:hypothetical protein